MNFLNFKKYNLIVGHYGSGKSNIAVNMAFSLKAAGKKVILCDLDIVNTYFRSVDSKEHLEAAGIDVISPIFANTNLDIPAMSPEIYRAFSDDDTVVIFDVGGDDSGAVALGQYKSYFTDDNYDMFYVFNFCRLLTQTAEDAAKFVNEIENTSRLKVTKIINNTNLGEETTESIIRNSTDKAEMLAKKLNLPIAATCVKNELENEFNDIKNLYPIKIYTKTLF